MRHIASAILPPGTWWHYHAQVPHYAVVLASADKNVKAMNELISQRTAVARIGGRG